MPSRSSAANPNNPLLKIPENKNLLGFGKGTGTPSDDSISCFQELSSAQGSPKGNSDPQHFGGISSAQGTPSDSGTWGQGVGQVSGKGKKE